MVFTVNLKIHYTYDILTKLPNFLKIVNKLPEKV